MIDIIVPEPPPWPPEENNQHADIDGDILVYHNAFASEGESPQSAQLTISGNLKDIIRQSGCGSWTIHLTGDNNYRKELATIQPYKGNRADKEKPEHYHLLRGYLQDFWEAQLHDDFEADDAMSISHYYASAPQDPRYKDVPPWSPPVDKRHLIVTQDKDLKGVLGGHLYNWRTEEFINLTPVESLRFFYTQCLTGDSVDHIKGLSLTREESKLLGTRSVGKKNAWVQGLDLLTEAEDMYQHVLGAYQDRHSLLADNWKELTEPLRSHLSLGPEEALLENARLLHMQEYIGQLWVPPSA